MRAALRYLALLLGRGTDDDHLVDLAIVALLIIVIVTLSLLFVGDPIADLITLIGGRVDGGVVGD